MRLLDMRGWPEALLTIAVSIACCCVLTLADEPVPAAPDAASSEPEALFEKHAAAGTLLFYETAREFQGQRWGRDYARLVREKWKGQAHAGISLMLKPLPDHVYRVGQPFDCLAVVTSTGDKAQRLDVGGSCGMTHALGLLIVPPQGGLDLGLGRGKVGGPHCFCKSQFESLEPGRSIKLATGFASEAAVAWKPEKPGDYLVIGTYEVPIEGGKPATVYSAPFVVTVVMP
jgi:hypothetical protein